MKKFAYVLGMILGMLFIVWLIPAMTVLAWSLLANTNILSGMVNSELLPSQITWLDAFVLCIFIAIASSFSVSTMRSND